MTTEQVVGYLLDREDSTFQRESLAWVCQQLMEAEVSGLIGAARGEGPRIGDREVIGPDVGEAETEAFWRSSCAAWSSAASAASAWSCPTLTPA